jgi:hypothetical protein
MTKHQAEATTPFQSPLPGCRWEVIAGAIASR